MNDPGDVFRESLKGLVLTQTGTALLEDRLIVVRTDRVITDDNRFEVPVALLSGAVLTRLDQVVGDGDLGTSLARGAPRLAPRAASATLKTLTSCSGMQLRPGATGAAVKAVQKSVKTIADGRYGSKIKATVAQWQKSHKIKTNGVVNATTWRALLKTQHPSRSRPPAHDCR